jgi:hypothetical protein
MRPDDNTNVESADLADGWAAIACARAACDDRPAIDGGVGTQCGAAPRMLRVAAVKLRRRGAASVATWYLGCRRPVHLVCWPPAASGLGDRSLTDPVPHSSERLALLVSHECGLNMAKVTNLIQRLSRARL